MKKASSGLPEEAFLHMTKKESGSDRVASYIFQVTMPMDPRVALRLPEDDGEGAQCRP